MGKNEVVGTKKWVTFVWGMVSGVVLVFVSLIVAFNFSSHEKSIKTLNEPIKATKKTLIKKKLPPKKDVNKFDATLARGPKIEAKFVNIILKAREKAKKIDNSLRLAGLKSKRNKELCALLSSGHHLSEMQLLKILNSVPWKLLPSISLEKALATKGKKLPTKKVVNWTGIVRDMGLDVDGDGVVLIEVAKGVIFRTMATDSENKTAHFHTPLKPNTKVFKQATQLKPGEKVRFSGYIMPLPPTCFVAMGTNAYSKLDKSIFLFNFDKLTPL